MEAGVRITRAAPVAALAVLALVGGCYAPASVPDDAPPGPGRCRQPPTSGPLAVEHSTIFQGGIGSPQYRIPSVVTTPAGVVVAFAEARTSLADPGAGRIDVVMRRSLDCGRTWEPMVVLGDNGADDAHNPTSLVAPGPDGRPTVFLFYNQRPRSPGGEFDIRPGEASMWLRTSTDDGATWSPPRQLTGLADPSWRVTSFGPGQGIVTRWGTAAAPAGRIIVPGWYTVETDPGGTFVILSDDGGSTWRLGGLPDLGTGEPQAVELTDGTVVLDSRGGAVGRTEFRSDDGGETWSAPTPGLPMGPITSGVVRHAAVRDGDTVDRLVHSGIARGPSPQSRYDVRVWTSGDEGRTWEHETVLQPGFAQYSLLTVLDDGTLGLVYESFGVSFDPPSAGLDIRFLRFDPTRIDPR